MAGADGLHQRIKIHHTGATEQDEGGIPAHQGEGFASQKSGIVVGDRRYHENGVALGKHRFERCGFDIMVTQNRRRQPGIEHADRGIEAGQEPVQSLAEIAESDNADFRTCQ